jgi:hypothetical protein
MALERTSRPGVTDFPDRANSSAPKGFTAEVRLPKLAGARVGD